MAGRSVKDSYVVVYRLFAGGTPWHCGHRHYDEARAQACRRRIGSRVRPVEATVVAGPGPS